MSKIKGDLTVSRNLSTRSARIEANVVTTAASTLTLTDFSQSTQIFLGSTTGQILNLGDATSYQVGHIYIVHNNSSVDVTIEDDGSTTLLTLNPNARATFILQNNSTADGIWVIDVSGGTSVGGALFQIEFTQAGGAGDKWLAIGSEDPLSNEITFTFPWAAELVGLTFANKLSNIRTEIKIFKALEGAGATSSLVFTWDLLSAGVRVARKTNISPAVTFNAGDKLAIFTTEEDPFLPPDTPFVALFFKITDDTQEEASEDFSGNIGE